MTVGRDTFIHDMLHVAGLKNVFTDLSRYPETNIEELKTKNTELVLLSSEPYPFKQKHIEELKAALPDAEIRLADGEIFSWYGSRMQYAPAYLANLLRQLKK